MYILGHQFFGNSKRGNRGITTAYSLFSAVFQKLFFGVIRLVLRLLCRFGTASRCGFSRA
jgi:hypothetical protein